MQIFYFCYDKPFLIQNLVNINIVCGITWVSCSYENLCNDDEDPLDSVGAIGIPFKRLHIFGNPEERA